MAEEKVKKEADLWYPADVENRIRKLCEQFPHGITVQMIQRDMPHVEPQQRANAINRLLSLGHLDLLKGSTGLLLKIKRPPNTSQMTDSDPQETPLYQAIKDVKHKDIQIKEEPEEEFIKEQLQDSFTIVYMKDDKSFLQTHGKDCGGAEMDCSSEPHEQFDSDGSQQTENSSDMDDDEDRIPTRQNKSTKRKETETNGEKCDPAHSQDCARNKSQFSKSECKRTQKIKTALKSSEKVTNPDLNVRNLGGKTKQCECTECGKTFQYNSDLQRHILSHIGKRPFSCTVCKNSYTRKVHLTSHMLSHTGERPFSCSVCKRSFREKSSLLKHMATHPGESPFRCTVCKECFTDRQTLKTHEKQQHREDKSFSCSECGALFSRNQHLLRHMAIHSGEKPFRCTDCRKSFSRADHLRLHMKTHSEDTLSSCPVCMECFTHKRTMRTHMRAHKKEQSADQ